ncbi:ASP2 [Auxenochlorella protothecoides x Auxenochlorella symbiontica]
MRGPIFVLLFISLCACTCLGSEPRQLRLKVTSRDIDWGPHPHRRLLLRNSSIPLHGAVKEFGYFFANVYLGSPARKFSVIVDTGSTMTYIPCAECGSSCGPNHWGGSFDPRTSNTSERIGCNSPKCICGSPQCGCTANTCTYTRSYAEHSSSSGLLVQDVMHLHDGSPPVPITFGCETRETGEIYWQTADGLLGMGRSPASVLNQLVAADQVANTFSLCLGSVRGDGALILGDAGIPAGVDMQYTSLITSSSHPYYYNVELEGVGVGGRMLSVDQAEYSSRGYGTVLDSGTTFSYFPRRVYKAFIQAVTEASLGAGLEKTTGPDSSVSDICFEGAPEFADAVGLSAVFPSLELEFAGGVRLTLHPLNYLFVHTFGTGKYCVGIFDNGNSGTLLGGIVFRNVLVHYDVSSDRVGFGLTECAALGSDIRPPCSIFDPKNLEAAATSGDCALTDSGNAKYTGPLDDGSISGTEEVRAADSPTVGADDAVSWRSTAAALLPSLTLALFGLGLMAVIGVVGAVVLLRRRAEGVWGEDDTSERSADTSGWRWTQGWQPRRWFGARDASGEGLPLHGTSKQRSSHKAPTLPVILEAASSGELPRAVPLAVLGPSRD